MKYLLIIISLFIIACDLTEPEVEETLNCKLLYSINKSTGLVSAPRVTDGTQSMVISGQTVYCVQCDWIKVTVKGDELLSYEYFRYGNYYYYEPDLDYKYYWKER